MTTATSTAVAKSETLVAIRPLAAFCGSYACTLADGDTVSTIFVEDEKGEIVKRRQPRKRFHGRVGFSRTLARDEFEALKSGGQPAAVEGFTAEVDLAVKVIRYEPIDAIVRVPPDMAADLVKRGLAERIAPTKAR